MPGDPYTVPTPSRPFLHEVGADPGRLRIGFTSVTGSGQPGHPDCVVGLDKTVALLAELGHEVVETSLPAFTPEEGDAIGVVFNSATAWIIGYWVHRLGRQPGVDELEPLTRAYWEMGKQASAGQYLAAIETLQRYSRRVAAFFVDHDVFLNPTMSLPPLPLGEMVSTIDDPLHALEVGGPSVAYSGVIANMTGQPAMSVPLHWTDDRLPIGMHFLGRYADEATLLRLAGQLEQARPWAELRPPVFAS
jgi:amidase